MEARQIGTLAADDSKKAAVYLRARTYNTVNKSHFTQAQQNTMIRVSDMLHTFFNVKPYVNFRKTMASIKFEKNAARTRQLREYEQYLETQGWEKKVTAQAVIYSIKKTALS